jgi:hypothetical protein
MVHVLPVENGRNLSILIRMNIGNSVSKCQPSNGMFSEAREGRDFQRTNTISVWLSPIYFALVNEDEKWSRIEPLAMAYEPGPLIGRETLDDMQTEPMPSSLTTLAPPIGVSLELLEYGTRRGYTH